MNKNKEKGEQPEPGGFKAGSVVSGSLAASGVVIRLQVFGVSLEVDRQALVGAAQHLAGQDQVFSLLPDAPDAARPRFAAHGDETERLPADAQVLLVYLPPCVGAHVLHPVQVFRVEEGLGGSVAAPVVPDVLLPLVLVEVVGGPAANVALDEGVVGVVPLGELAGSVVFSQRPMPQQETDGEAEKSPEGSHYPEFLVFSRVTVSAT